MRAGALHHTNTVRRFIITGGRRHFMPEKNPIHFTNDRGSRDLGHRSGPTVADSEAIRKRLAGDHIGLCTLVNSLSRHLLEPGMRPGLPIHVRLTAEEKRM